MHKKKFKMFKGDAENEENSAPTRIESYFSSIFHLIDACMAKNNLHIDKHQRVRTMIEANPEVFGNKGEEVWRAFQKIENQIRPGQTYGGKINGKELMKTQKLYGKIKSICLEILGKKNDFEKL